MGNRSPNYPRVGLSDAVTLAQQLWSREKRTAVPQDVAVKAWGYTSLSGIARSKLAALRQYGLVDDGKDGVALSPLGLEIIHHPVGSEEYSVALREAALSVDLFRELARTHAHASLDGLKAYLITRKGFSDTGADKVISSFKDTLRFAALDVSGYSEEDAWASDESTSDEDEMSTQASMVAAPPKPHPTGRVFMYQLSPQITAELRFTGATDLRPRHIDLLKSYLEVAKTALNEETDGEG